MGVLRSAKVTIPEGESIWGGVMDDVDDDGKWYGRSIEGPVTVFVDQIEGDDEHGPSQIWWEVRDECLALSDEAVVDLLVGTVGVSTVAVEPGGTE